MELKNWATKQLTDFKLIDRVDESKLRETFTSKTHDCDLRIIGLYWTSFNNEKTLYVTATDEEQLFKMKFMNPILPRVKSLEELLNGKIFAACHYGQYTAQSCNRKILSCYCKIEKTDGKKFNLSTASLDKDLGEFVNSLPTRKMIQIEDHVDYSDLPIRDLRDL